MQIFVYWLALIPLIVFSGAYMQLAYEQPKVTFYLIGGSLLLIFWIIRILKNKGIFNFTKADYLFFVWLLILLVSSLFGVHPLESIIGGSYRHQGFIFFLALWLIGITIRILKNNERKFLIKCIGVTILIESVLAVFQFLFKQLYLGKSLGTLGEANAVAGFIAIGSYFVFEAFPKIFSFLLVIPVILEFSRSGIISFLPNLYIFVRESVNKYQKFAIAIILGIVVFLSIFISFKKGNSPFENHITILQLGIEKVIQKPILGYGAESGEVVYKQAFYKSGFPLSNLIIDRSHNLFLDITMWSGISGLIFFIGWIYLSFKNLDISKKMALISFLLYSMFEPLSVVHWILLIIIVNI